MLPALGLMLLALGLGVVVGGLPVWKRIGSGGESIESLERFAVVDEFCCWLALGLVLHVHCWRDGLPWSLVAIVGVACNSGPRKSSVIVLRWSTVVGWPYSWRQSSSGCILWHQIKGFRLCYLSKGCTMHNTTMCETKDMEFR